jgi:acetyltransferase-like isoleucine patch superfamily enzyme
MNPITFFYSLIFFLRIKIRRNSFISGFPTVRGWVKLFGSGSINIGSNVRLNSGISYNPIGGDTKLFLISNEGAELIIGDQVGISNSTIFCSHSIVIDDRVMIGGSVKIYDTNFHSLDTEVRNDRILDKKNAKKAKVKIGNSAFIGAHSIILKGSIIDEGAVVGAGTIVRGHFKNKLL